MSRARWTVLPVACLALGLFTRCFPLQERADEAADSALTSSLEAEGLLLSWTPGNSWAQGRCLDLKVTNKGNDLASWSLVVRLDQPVTGWYSTYGANLTHTGDIVTVEPTTSALPKGGSVTFQYCAEPVTQPVEILSADVVPVEETPVPSTPTPTPTPAPTPTPTPEYITGAIVADPIALSYRTDGSSHDATCLELTVSNISSRSLASWYLQVDMSGQVSIRDYWGFTFLAGSNTLTVYPGQGGQTLAAYQSRVGTVCLEPLVVPRSMVASVEDQPTDRGTLP